MIPKLKRSTQKKIAYVIKIVITILVLIFIIKKVDLTKLIADIGSISFLTILIIVFTTIIKIFIQFNNWNKYLFLNKDYKPKKYEVVKSYFIGMAFHFILPAGIGFFGKMYFVNNQKYATTFSVSVERIFVTWKNIFFAAIAAVFYFRDINIFFKIIFFLIIFISPFLIYLVSYFIKTEKLKSFFKNYLNIIPRIMIMQIIFAIISIFQYFIILNNFDKIHFWEVFITVPLIHVSHLIPVSFSGFGIREIFAIELFSKYDVTPEIAVSTTLIIFIINTVLPGLVGEYFLIKEKVKI